MRPLMRGFLGERGEDCLLPVLSALLKILVTLRKILWRVLARIMKVVVV